MNRANRLAIAAAGLSLGWAVPAWAQLGPGGGIGGGHAPSHSESDEAKPVAPPPAIPGAAAPDQVAPASKTAKDLDPNAALFDAIDRGDATAARDALNRGADLNARNVLGQRPLDMSIDLSRNSITFLLLSMRSQIGDPNAGAPVQETDTPPPPPDKEHRVAHRRQARPVEIAAAQRRATVDAEAPQPSAGFLGFGSR